jgi:undecaprenyl-diphosphatase
LLPDVAIAPVVFTRRLQSRTASTPHEALAGTDAAAGPSALELLAGAGARLLLGFGAFVAIGWGAGELWTSVVGSLEQEAMHSLAAGRAEPWITTARIVTWAGSAFLLVPLAAGCCLLLARAGMRREALAVALSLGGAMLLADLVKLLTSRPRPSVEHLQLVGGSSFPSAHATQASAFWLALALTLRARAVRRRILWEAVSGAVLVALVVAWSRVYLGVHYPSDVVAGLVLGGGWALFVARVMRTR